CAEWKQRERERERVCERERERELQVRSVNTQRRRPAMTRKHSCNGKKALKAQLHTAHEQGQRSNCEKETKRIKERTSTTPNRNPELFFLLLFFWFPVLPLLV